MSAPRSGRGILGSALGGRLDGSTARQARRLALATAAAAAFRMISYGPLQWVTVSTTVAVVLLVAAAATLAASGARRPAGVAVVGAVLLLLGLFRLFSYGHGSAGIGGAASTAALLTALGIAQLGILAARERR